MKRSEKIWLMKRGFDVLMVFSLYFTIKAAVRNGVREALNLKGLKRKERINKIQKFFNDNFGPNRTINF